MRTAPGARIGRGQSHPPNRRGIGFDQPITNVMAMDEMLTQSLGDTRFYMQLLSCICRVAVFLAGIGIYGVMSYFVSQHTHDIGIRMALGAHPSQILSWLRNWE